MRAVVAAAVLPALAAQAEERKPFTADDLWAVQRVGAPVLSPDGRTAAYTVSTYDGGENRLASDIWLLALDSKATRRLTTHKASDSGPVWSPDGRRIAFVSKRDGDAAGQLYMMDVAGGEPERLTDMPQGVGSVRWLPDGRRLAFVSEVVAGAEAPEETKKAVEARAKNKVTARATENRLYRAWDRWLTDPDYPHLFVVEVDSRKVTDLLPGSRRYFDVEDGSGQYDISPDGKLIVFAAVASPEPYATLNSDLFSVPTAGGEVKQLTADNPGDDGRPVFSPDGRTVAYGRDRKGDGWPDYTRLSLLDLASGRTTDLTEGWDSSVGDVAWTKDGRQLLFHAERKGRRNLYVIAGAPGGAPREVYRGGRTGSGQLAADGRVVFTWHTLSQPPEIARVGLDGKGFELLTHTNDALVSRVAWGEVRDVTFKGARDEDVQMFVVYPPGFDRTKKYPLVHVVHGGPVGISGDEFHFRWNAQAFAAPGYIAALVNFHGSSSFGQPWVESILGAHPDLPFTDVMKATDLLIAEGNVDPGRMAAMGGSYGGFLVNWIAGHTTRFKALVSHSGVYDLMAQFASDNTYGRQHSYGGYPFKGMENVERWSPNRYSADMVTPMLVIHGEKDYRVPVAQGLELYGVLQAKGVPARLVYYPDENHWILKGANSKYWYGEVLGWLARWLK